MDKIFSDLLISHQQVDFTLYESADCSHQQIDSLLLILVPADNTIFQRNQHKLTITNREEKHLNIR